MNPGTRVVVNDPRWEGEAGVVLEMKSPGGRVWVALDSGPFIVVAEAVVEPE